MHMSSEIVKSPESVAIISPALVPKSKYPPSFPRFRTDASPIFSMVAPLQSCPL